MNAKQVIRKIRTLDPTVRCVSQVGSHQKWLVKSHCTVVVPVHGGRDIPSGTLGSIQRQGAHCLGARWLRP